MIYIIFALAIIFNAGANILIKIGMNEAVLDTGFNIFRMILIMLKNIYVMSGVFSFGLALVLYSYVLSRVNLSIAYPLMTSLGFAIVVSFSVIFFKESLQFLQIIGLILIVAGVWMVAAFR